jgi:hypothetical protein
MPEREWIIRSELTASSKTGLRHAHGSFACAGFKKKKDTEKGRVNPVSWMGAVETGFVAVAG